MDVIVRRYIDILIIIITFPYSTCITSSSYTIIVDVFHTYTYMYIVLCSAIIYCTVLYSAVLYSQ